MLKPLNIGIGDQELSLHLIGMALLKERGDLLLESFHLSLKIGCVINHPEMFVSHPAGEQSVIQ